ncbi:MAG: beta-lactamase family protein [Acidobacteria bacterium]|nr:beta-lactamase family protein [Acidobacteriota bacterium]
MLFLIGTCFFWAATPFSEEPRYPDPDWPVATDYAWLRMSKQRLAAYETFLRDKGERSWISIVIKKGKLVYEGCGTDTYLKHQRDFGSIIKPLQATVLGAALHQGRLKSLDENALHYWRDPWQTPYANDRQISFRQFAQYRDRWNEAAPAGSFRYNNAAATAAGECIAGSFTEVRGPKSKKTAEVARREVMEKIGARWHLWHWERDFDENPSNPGPRMVLEADVYELAKLGYLWLRKGIWKQTRIFSDEYYQEAVTDWSPNTGNAQFGFCGHYGYWWFVNARQILLPEVPEDAFYHIGNGSPQYATALLIIPSHNVVAVLSMRRISDEGKWDVIQNSRLPSNEGPRLWAREVAKLNVEP